MEEAEIELDEERMQIAWIPDDDGEGKKRG